MEVVFWYCMNQQNIILSKTVFVGHTIQRNVPMTSKSPEATQGKTYSTTLRPYLGMFWPLFDLKKTARNKNVKLSLYDKFFASSG